MAMDRNLALELVCATEAAALSCARLMGRGDEWAADQSAVGAMRAALNHIDMDATIIIGEGDSEDVPMLFAGERVGSGEGPKIELAVGPLEGTTICATGGANALSVIAATEAGGFLRAPDTYMEKIAVGPEARGVIDIDRSVTENLRAVAEAKSVPVEDLTMVILDRPRHEPLILEARETGARIKLIKDGDVSAAISTCTRMAGVDILMGTGGAAEGVIAAAALRCLGGGMQGRLRPRTPQEVAALKAAGVHDIGARLGLSDLISGDVMFAATGVTGGDLLQGVRFRAAGALTQSVVMHGQTGTVRYIDTEHNFRQAAG